MAANELILIIDDDADFNALSRRALERAGYRVIAANSIAEALRALERERPALIASDLMMDTADAGFQFARRLKDNPETRDIPLILLTAISGKLGLDFAPKDQSELAAMGADAFLPKPVQAQALTEKVAELLKRSAT